MFCLLCERFLGLCLFFFREGYLDVFDIWVREGQGVVGRVLYNLVYWVNKICEQRVLQEGILEKIMSRDLGIKREQDVS